MSTSSRPSVSGCGTSPNKHSLDASDEVAPHTPGDPPPPPSPPKRVRCLCLCVRRVGISAEHTRDTHTHTDEKIQAKRTDAYKSYSIRPRRRQPCLVLLRCRRRPRAASELHQTAEGPFRSGRLTEPPRSKRRPSSRRAHRHTSRRRYRSRQRRASAMDSCREEVIEEPQAPVSARKMQWESGVLSKEQLGASSPPAPSEAPKDEPVNSTNSVSAPPRLLLPRRHHPPPLPRSPITQIPPMAQSLPRPPKMSLGVPSISSRSASRVC